MLYEYISQISISVILDRVGIKYSYLGCNCLGLWEYGKMTDGWKANLIENYINDFSKDRASGGPYSFIKLYLGLSDKETFKRFADNFGIENNNQNILKKKKYYNKKGESIRLPKYYANW